MKINTINDCTILNNGLKMPWLGFGVYKIDSNQETEIAVKTALEMGYRSIDTASFYGNEKGVGKAIIESEIPREEIFLTTKIWTTDMRAGRTLAAFEESLDQLQTNYVDLYMIHWPAKGFYIETWEAMQEIYQSRRAKAIGVCNCLESHLQDIITNCTIVPQVNQVEFHPQLLQPKLLKFCQENAIQLQASSPLMRGQIINEPTILKLAQKYNKTSAQIVLRWNLQHKVVTIPKSVTNNRIFENTQLFDFELSEVDMATIDALDIGKRVGSDPNNFKH